MQRFTFFIIMLTVLASCAGHQNKADSAQLPAELSEAWNKAWNNKDSAAIVNMFDKNISMNTGQKYKGIDSMKRWVSHYIPRIANLRTKQVNVVQSAGMIVYSCTFQHNEMRKDAIAGISTGLSSFVYIKNSDGWKLRYIQMQEFQ